MASLRLRGDTYAIVFRWNGQQITRSLDETNKNRAESLLGRLKLQLQAVRQGVGAVPDGADPVDWLLGRAKGPKAAASGLRTLDDLLSRYVADTPDGAMEATSKVTESVHHGHLRREIGERTPLASIGAARLQRYVVDRSALVAAETIKKELATLRVAWRWAHAAKLAPEPPSFIGLRYPKRPQTPPFRHAEEIRAILRSDPSANEEEMWESLVLTTDEVHAVVAFVAKHWSHHPWFVDAWTIAAYTGCRRSELTRLRAEHIDLARQELTITEKKRVRNRSESRRSVQIAGPLLPTLKRLKTRGGFLIVRNERGIALANALTYQWSEERQPEKSPWKHVKGFHVLRHSFASNLAAAGVSQSLIDAWMGHQTEEQRSRYRHFFPGERSKAIRALG